MSLGGCSSSPKSDGADFIGPENQELALRLAQYLEGTTKLTDELQRMRSDGKFPGIDRAAHGRLKFDFEKKDLEGPFYPFKGSVSGEVDSDDSIIFHYTISKANAAAPIAITRAWKANKEGAIVEVLEVL